MSNRLQALVGRMRRDALSSRYRCVFVEALQPGECLAQYQSVADVLEVFSDRHSARFEEINYLTGALIVEHRKRTNPLWATLLAIAYHPMLSCLRSRAVSASIAPTELDQLLLCAFLETLETIPIERNSTQLVLLLHRRTARAFFTMLKRELNTESLLAQLELAAPEALHPRSLERQQRNQLLFADLCRRIGDDIDDVDLRLIAASALGCDETPLAEQLAHHGEGLRRKRTRALVVLREAISPKDGLFDPSA